jgi:hypothetical protein
MRRLGEGGSVNDFTDKDKSDIEYLINEAIEDIPQ